MIDYVVQTLVSIAWPLVVVIALVMFRHEISRAVQLLEKVKFPGGEATFRQKLNDVDDKAEALRQREQARDAGKDQGPSPYSIKDLEAISPRGTVLESWLTVEDRLRTLAAARNIDSGKRVPASKLIHILQHQNVLSEDLAGLVHDLRVVRNEAVHSRGQDLTASIARDYARNCIVALQWIDLRLDRGA